MEYFLKHLQVFGGRAYNWIKRCLGHAMNDDFKRYLCLGCGFLYDEQLGLPEYDIPPGTRWADIPDDWVCPDCGTSKSNFELVEIPYADDEPARSQPT